MKALGEAFLATDVLYKVYDLVGDHYSPTSYSFDVAGISVSHTITVTGNDLGTLFAGSRSPEPTTRAAPGRALLLKWPGSGGVRRETATSDYWKPFR